MRLYWISSISPQPNADSLVHPSYCVPGPLLISTILVKRQSHGDGDLNICLYSKSENLIIMEISHEGDQKQCLPNATGHDKRTAKALEVGISN